MSRYLGKVCEKHPERGGERVRFPSGRTVCVECNYRRVQAWKKQDLVYQMRLKAYRKTRKAKDATNERRRVNHAVDDGLSA